jgi:RecB family exonuclease
MYYNLWGMRQSLCQPIQGAWGLCQGRWMRGIIDQIELDADGHALIVEHKTRRNPSLPSHAQKLTAQLQVKRPLSSLCL